jgi:A/G-specific adenine glycosylase
LLLDELAPDARCVAQDDPAFLHVLTHKDLHLHPVSVAYAVERPPIGSGSWFGAGEWPVLGLPAPVRKLLAAAD